MSTVTFSRQGLFWLGTAGIVCGVLSHLPMFIHSAGLHYRMVGMPMDGVMIVGMFAIVIGVIAAFFALLPRRSPQPFGAPAKDLHLRLRAIDDAPLTRRHWQLLATLAIAVVVDVMKPATLGLVVPGMTDEYQLDRQTVALFPLTALIGTAIGSAAWGLLADKVGRRAAILLSALMFIGTSICGAMPAFEWNLAMCFLMGLSAGGLLPITFTLIAEMAPARHRGWMMVLVGGLGTSCGYLAATGNAALLEPIFGWRALWFAGVPSGLSLIFLNRYLPESPRFLCLRGRIDEARQLLSGFGIVLETHMQSETENRRERGHAHRRDSPTVLVRSPYTLLTIGLTLCGVAWGLANFGFMLWMPANLRAAGLSAEVSNELLARSAFLALPGAVLVAWLYRTWSSKQTLIAFVALAGACLVSFGLVDLNSQMQLTVMLVILLVALSGVIAVLLPYSTEIYPLEVRATGAGIVAGSSKFGGIIGSALGAWSLVTGLTAGAILAAIPIVLSALVLLFSAVETRGRRLEEIQPDKSDEGGVLRDALKQPQG